MVLPIPAKTLQWLVLLLNKILNPVSIKKKIKHFAIRLTKVQNLYSENYETLLKDIKEELNKWKDTSCSGTWRLNIIKLTILPDLTYKFNSVSIKISVGFCVEIDKIVLKIMWKFKGPGIAKAVLKKKNKLGRLILSDFEACWKVTIIKAVWLSSLTYSSMEQNWETRNNTHTCGQLLFDGSARITQQAKNSLFNQIVLEKLESHMQKNGVNSLSSYHTQKINTKWTSDLHLKTKTIKLLEILKKIFVTLG